MTADMMIALLDQPELQKVRVTARDYAYEGWLVIAFNKRSGALRCVVEDDNGRLFIHNAGQLSQPLERA